jgi:hypothetical protein
MVFAKALLTGNGEHGFIEFVCNARLYRTPCDILFFPPFDYSKISQEVERILCVSDKEDSFTVSPDPYH